MVLEESGGTPELATLRAGTDFDGDGKTDYAVTRTSGTQKVWYYSASASSTPPGVPWGLNGDREIAADFDGDGITDIGVWRDSHAERRPKQSIFYVLRSSDQTVLVAQFGRDGDNPAVVGDYDGDGKADPAVFRETELELTHAAPGTLCSTIGHREVSRWRILSLCAGVSLATCRQVVILTETVNSAFCVTSNINGAEHS